jgi:hypothetical protein
MSTWLEKYVWSGCVEKDEVDIIIDTLYSTATLEYLPNNYRKNLTRAVEIIKSGSEENLQERYSRGKIGELTNAVSFSVELVGFRVNLTDSEGYRGSLGVSPTIWKLYAIDDSMKAKLGILSLYPKVEGNLSPLSLRMHRDNAKMLLGPERVEEAKGDVIEPVTFKLHTAKIKIPEPPQRPITIDDLEKVLKPLNQKD